MNFTRVAALIAGFMEREGGRLALAGAFALHAYGVTRTTSDLDFVTETAFHDKLITFLESLGYETLHSSEGYSNHVHPDPEMGRVDIIYVGGSTANLMLAAPGASLRFGDRDLPVPRAEYLAAMKIHAMKNDPTRTLRDLADIQEILRLRGVDHGEVRSYFENAGLSEKFDELKRSL